MMNHSHQLLSINCMKLFLLIYLLFFSPYIIADNADHLRETYKEIKGEILRNNYGLPIHLQSKTENNAMRGDVSGIIHHSFETVSKNLSSLTNWCEIMPMHLNIKACTYHYVNDQCKLIFYSGRKFYEKADDVYHLDYQFQVSSLDKDYFNASLTSKEGPLDTTDYLIIVEAIPLTDNATFLHFTYEYKYGFWARLAMSTYFATLGHNKTGFTIIGNDDQEHPIYVKGIRGVVERNAMRYYFAIQSFLDTKNTPVEKRFSEKISHWFDLTEKHHKQLYEINKQDYLKYKNREHQDQIRLQKEMYKNNPLPIPESVTSCLAINEP